MDAMVYLDQENGTLAAPSLKFRQRLQSAPEHLLKTPLKTRLGAPVQSGRKALGTVNKIVATPAASNKGDVLNKPLAAQQCKVAPQPVCEDYPEIEKCFPYDPSDFEVYSVPEEVCISRFSLAGLGKQQWSLNVLEEDFMIQPCLQQSPLMMPSALLGPQWMRHFTCQGR
ncbi:securin isoform X2 [Neoarius graeffei]|uniref:securin isoform X2 n=1 Tax=Neoarius graeffei TaxID=443677 RepID=UPI00298D15CB|nr:securin isoform X2 [Neoarius graeffei]